MSQQAKYVGEVKWFNAVKGFGFIGSTDNTTDWPTARDKDIFVHYTAIVDSGYKKLTEHDAVEFSVEEGKDHRLQAIQVVNLTNENRRAQTTS